MSLLNLNDSLIDVGSWYRAATERRELLAMEDRMLRDVGVNRLDVQRILRGCPAPVEIAPAWPAPISPQLRDAYIARARRLRNQAFRDAFLALLRWLKPQRIERTRKLTLVTR